jgi:hypothetical protein
MHSLNLDQFGSRSLRVNQLSARETEGDGGGRSPDHPAQSAHVVCGSQRLPNISDFFQGNRKNEKSSKIRFEIESGANR